MSEVQEKDDEQEEETRSKWDSRKLIVAVGTTILSSALLVFDQIDQTAWQNVVIATVGAYIVSQAWENRSAS